MQIKELAQRRATRHGRAIQMGGAVAAGILLMAATLRPQMPAVGPVWEYSSITGTPFSAGYEGSGNSATHSYKATICYSGVNGCRNEQVTTSTGSGPEGSDALMMAAAKLGERGWELASTTEISSDSRYQRVMYFKRLKSVLNRSETR